MGDRKLGQDGRDSGLVRSVVRALGLLRLMNLRPSWTLQALHRETKLPKPTLCRLLATLRNEGYVVAESLVGVYRLTSKVKELDSGYTEMNRMIDLASSVLIKLTKKIQWPVALGLLEQDSIVIRCSTIPYSPLAVYSNTLGQKRNILQTALGLAYLAFCPADERESLIDAQFVEEGATPLETLHCLERDLQQIVSVGFAVRRGKAKVRSSTLAVPVLRQGQSIAALSMTTFVGSMTPALISRHVPILQQVAEVISFRLDAGEAGNGPAVAGVNTDHASSHCRI